MVDSLSFAHTCFAWGPVRWGLENRVKWHKTWQIMIKESLVVVFLEVAVGMASL